MARSEQEMADGLSGEQELPERWKDVGPDEPEDEASLEETVEDETVLADGEPEDEDESTEAADESSGTMRAVEFAKAAGWKLEDFYNGVTVPIDGADVPLGKALNEARAMKSAHEALSRERDELREKVNQTSAAAPVGNPNQLCAEAQNALARAKFIDDALISTDWSQYDAAQAANHKLDLQAQSSQLKQEAQAKQGEFQQKWQAQYAKAKEEADRQTRALIPAWNDRSVHEADMQKQYDLAAKYGVPRQMMDAVLHPGLRHLLYDAQVAMAGQKAIQTGAKKVRKVSKTLGAGARPSGQGKPSLSEVSRQIREAKSPEEKRRIRHESDLGPLR